MTPETTQTPQPAPSMDMESFFSKYGADAEAALEDSGPAEVRKPETGKPNGAPADDLEADDLDSATLQALGLAPEDKPSPEGETTEATPEGTEQPAIDLESLAKTLGVDAKDLTFDAGELKVRTKVDGQENLTPFKKLQEGYQLREHFTRQNEAFLAQKQQWEQAQQQQAQQFEDAARMAYDVLTHEEQALQKSYTKDWNQLRQDDPAEYAAQVAEYNQKLSDVKGRQQQLQQHYQGRMAQAQQQQAQQHQMMREQGVKVLAENLGWDSPEKFQEGAKKLRGYLQTSVGLSDQEIQNTLDPRALIAAEKARKYDELMSKVDLARKKVTAVHQVPRGTASRPAGVKKRDLGSARQRLAEDHSVEAAADYFTKLGIV